MNDIWNQTLPVGETGLYFNPAEGQTATSRWVSRTTPAQRREQVRDWAGLGLVVCALILIATNEKKQEVHIW